LLAAAANMALLAELAPSHARSLYAARWLFSDQEWESRFLSVAPIWWHGSASRARLALVTSTRVQGWRPKLLAIHPSMIGLQTSDLKRPILFW
jgi:hypothetical protein